MLYLFHSAKGSTWKKHKYISRNNGKYIYSSEDSRRYREDAEKLRNRSLDSVEKIDKKIDAFLYGTVNYDYKKLGKTTSSKFFDRIIKEADAKTKQEQQALIWNASDFFLRAYGYTFIGKKYARFEKD